MMNLFKRNQKNNIISTNNSNNKIIINGKSISVSGNNITSRNGVILVDGQVVAEGLSGDVHIIFEGDLASLDTNGSATINGNVEGNVDSNGSVKIGGNVQGGIDAGGSVNVGADVGGNIDAGGSVNCGNVQGDIDAGCSVKYKK